MLVFRSITVKRSDALGPVSEWQDVPLLQWYNPFSAPLCCQDTAEHLTDMCSFPLSRDLSASAPLTFETHWVFVVEVSWAWQQAEQHLWSLPTRCQFLLPSPQVGTPHNLSRQCPVSPGGINWPRGEPRLQMRSKIDQAAPSEMCARIGAQSIEIDFR